MITDEGWIFLCGVVLGVYGLAMAIERYPVIAQKLTTPCECSNCQKRRRFEAWEASQLEKVTSDSDG